MSDRAVRVNLMDLSPTQLRAWFLEQGQPAYRSRQLQDWLCKRWAAGFAAMTNLPEGLRAALGASFRACSLVLERRVDGADGTVKWLFRLSDGERIETVLIRASNRRTVCLSTQVGCPVRCAFCASGSTGLVRNLTVAEIVDQVFAACRALGERVTHIVVMGMGEPLLNLDNLLTALELFTDPDRFGLGARHVTVSTSGIVPGIRRLADRGRPWNLALSLHAPGDRERSRLIPPGHRYPLAEIVEACAYYREKTNRMVTFEYTLLRGLNDGNEHMLELARLALAIRAKVNLIPCNPVSGTHRPPLAADVERCLGILVAAGVRATLRIEKGAGIQAACGQLRRRAGRD